MDHESDDIVNHHDVFDDSTTNDVDCMIGNNGDVDAFTDDNDTTNTPPTTNNNNNNTASSAAANTTDVQQQQDSNIFVAVRVRPPNKMERNDRLCIRVLDDKVVVLLDKYTDANDFLRVNRSRERRYAFDYAFDDTCSQVQVYEKTSKMLIPSIMQGYNATIFAYGQTGSGKTHTMIGDIENPGIMAQTLGELFSRASQDGEQMYKVVVSFLEVYNENIRDLLNPEVGVLELREDPVKGMEVAGITELEATSSSEVMDLLRKGNQNRTTEPTAANQVSSRSHAVLQVVVESKDRTANVEENICVGKLSLIDLAGSERAAVTQNRGIRMVEGANINRSLLALANCINALGSKTPGHFVPYRDSKLTRLLKDSLGGNCRTVMITNISPSEASYEETHNSLKYANRAKNIKTKAVKNVFNVQYHITRYTEIIKSLRSEVQQLKLRLFKRENTGSSGAGGRFGPMNGADDGNNYHSTDSSNSGGRLSATAMAEAEDIRTQLMEGYSEIVSLKRMLIEKAEQNFDDQFHLSKLRAQLAFLESFETSSSELKVSGHVTADIDGVKMEIHSRERSVDEYSQLKGHVEERIQEVRDHLGSLMENVSRTVKDAQLQMCLDLEYQLHSTEVAKLQYEETGCLQEVLVKQMELDVARLQEQLQIRDRMIAKQRQALETNNLRQPSFTSFTDYVASEFIEQETGYVGDMSVVTASHGSPLLLKGGADLSTLSPTLAKKSSTPSPKMTTRTLRSKSVIGHRKSHDVVSTMSGIPVHQARRRRTNSMSTYQQTNGGSKTVKKNANTKSYPSRTTSQQRKHRAPTHNTFPPMSSSPSLSSSVSKRLLKSRLRKSQSNKHPVKSLATRKSPSRQSQLRPSHSPPAGSRRKQQQQQQQQVRRKQRTPMPMHTTNLRMPNIAARHRKQSVSPSPPNSPLSTENIRAGNDVANSPSDAVVAKRFTKEDRLKLLRLHKKGRNANPTNHRRSVMTKKQIRKQRQIMSVYGAPGGGVGKRRVSHR